MLRQQNSPVNPARASTPGLDHVAEPVEIDGVRQDHGRFRRLMKLRTSGYFYRLDAPLDGALAHSVFQLIQAKRSVTAVHGAPYFCGTPRTRERIALCVFEIRRAPAFAPMAEELIETRYGFCCLVEANEVLVVAHSGFAWSDALLPFDDPKTLTQDDARAVLGSIRAPRVDKVATRSMSVGAKSIHARTLEGDDLESSLPSLGAGRHVVRSIRAVEAATGATLNIVPGSSRLTQLGPRTELKEMVSWIRREMLGRLASRKRLAFLARFAQSIRFDELPTTVEPAGLSLALALPSFAGLDWEYEASTGKTRKVTAKRMRALFDRLRLRLGTPMALENRGGKLVARYPAPIGDVFVTENKKSYSIESKFLRRLRFMDPDTATPRSLLSALNETRSFLITFSNLEYAYVSGQLVQTAHVTESLATVLRAVEVHEELAQATSEKGKLRGKVDRKSLFGIIERSCAKQDALLLLDDGSTEWSDYIGLSTRAGQPTLSFYHAKHTGKPSTSASVLQEVIGQAEKNIGWLRASPALLTQRAKDHWGRPYKWPGGGTVKRVRRKRSKGAVAALLCDAAANPKTQRRACVVVSSLTRTILERLVRSKGDDLAPNETQLAWLLAVFVSSCAEAGVQPVIMCPR